MVAVTAAPRPGLFPTTRWDRIADARCDARARRELLGEMFCAYQRPLYVHVRRRGVSAQDAEDAVAGFFAHLVEGKFLSKLDPRRGRLRSYLRISMNHYLADLRERSGAIKRGGGRVCLSLDVGQGERALEDSGALTPDIAYDQTWARLVLERAFDDLRAEYESGSRSGPVELLEEYFSTDGRPACRNLASKYGMSESGAKSFLHRARLRYRELVRAEVAQAVCNPSDAEDELRYLLDVLRR